MLRVLFWLAVVLVALGGAVTAGALAFRVWLASDGGQAWLREEISEQCGMDVDFARLSGPLPWGVDLDAPRLTTRDGKLHASARRVELRWSLGSLLRRDPSLRVRVVEPSARFSGKPSLPRLPLPRAHVVLRVEDGSAHGELHGRWDPDAVDLQGSFTGPGVTGRLTAHGPVDAVQIDGTARMGRGRARLQGRAALTSRRARLRIRFHDLEPRVAGRDRMILSGVSRVMVSGGRARFYIAGRYRHRRTEPFLSGVAGAPVPGGLVEGRGTLRFRRRLVGGFALNLYDRGHAARLLASRGLGPEKVVLHGRYDRRLRMHLESQ